MREIFVDYEIANKMRGLGFCEPCIASINFRNNIFLGGDSMDPDYIPTPTWDQSFDWLIKTPIVRDINIYMYKDGDMTVEISEGNHPLGCSSRPRYNSKKEAIISTLNNLKAMYKLKSMYNG